MKLAKCCHDERYVLCTITCAGLGNHLVVHEGGHFGSSLE